MRAQFYPLVTDLERLKEEAAEGVPYPFVTEELLELSPKDYRQFCSALGQRYAFETDIPKEGYDTVYGAFHCSLVTAVSEKEAILLTRVAAQIFGAYLPDKTLLDLTGVPKKQVTLESCHNPEIHIGHPDASGDRTEAPPCYFPSADREGTAASEPAGSAKRVIS